MNSLKSKYFWLLDQEISTERLEIYKKNLGGTEGSTFSKWLSLLEAKVPFPPCAYLNTESMEGLPAGFPASLPANLKDKLNPEALNELSDLLTRLEELNHSQLGGLEKPLLLTVQGDFCGSVRNIGVCPKSLPALIHLFGTSTTYAIYIDFLESYSTRVLGAPFYDFRKVFGLVNARHGTSPSAPAHGSSNISLNGPVIL